eukprot:scaffold200670_cov30-Prasinocladus_malaysianus.AAC.1
MHHVGLGSTLKCLLVAGLVGGGDGGRNGSRHAGGLARPDPRHERADAHNQLARQGSRERPSQGGEPGPANGLRQPAPARGCFEPAEGQQGEGPSPSHGTPSTTAGRAPGPLLPQRRAAGYRVDLCQLVHEAPGGDMRPRRDCGIQLPLFVGGARVGYRGRP